MSYIKNFIISYKVSSKAIDDLIEKGELLSTADACTKIDIAERTLAGLAERGRFPEWEIWLNYKGKLYWINSELEIDKLKKKYKWKKRK
jgi:hypothetical protein